MKRTIKKLAHFMGIFRISTWTNRRLISILMYHGFSQGDGLAKIQGKHQSQILFEKHLKIITRYCTPVTLHDIIGKGDIPPNPVIITFDDGYKNNYSIAFPLLRKYSVPATIFVTTGFVDRTYFMWTDHLDYIINNAREFTSEFIWEDDKVVIDLSSEDKKKQTIVSLKEYLKEIPDKKKRTYLQKLQSSLDIEYDWDNIPESIAPLEWDEIRNMKESGLIDIGSHTVSHPILAQCSREEQYRELKISKQRIEEELRVDCPLFAFPNGWLGIIIMIPYSFSKNWDILVQ